MLCRLTRYSEISGSTLGLGYREVLLPIITAVWLFLSFSICGNQIPYNLLFLVACWSGLGAAGVWARF